MKRELSAREKGLIYALGCVVAFTIVILLLLLPGLDRLQEVKADRADAEARRTETETIIKNQAANEAALEEIQSQAQDKTAAYYRPMDPEEADLIVSGIITRYGFTPTTLSMEPLAEATITPYRAGEATEAETAQEETGAEDTEALSLQSYQVTISGEGTSNQVAGLVGEICLNPSLHLISFDNQISVNEENVYDDSGILTSTNTVTTYSVTVTVELFTYETYTPQTGDGEEDVDSGNNSAMDYIPGGITDTTDDAADDEIDDNTDGDDDEERDHNTDDDDDEEIDHNTRTPDTTDDTTAATPQV